MLPYSWTHMPGYGNVGHMGSKLVWQQALQVYMCVADMFESSVCSCTRRANTAASASRRKLCETFKSSTPPSVTYAKHPNRKPTCVGTSNNGRVSTCANQVVISHEKMPPTQGDWTSAKATLAMCQCHMPPSGCCVNRTRSSRSRSRRSSSSCRTVFAFSAVLRSNLSSHELRAAGDCAGAG